jgi:predicted nucleic acid-binding protein
MTIDDLVVRHRRVGIDSNVFIYLFEGSAAEAVPAGLVLDAIEAGRCEGVLATVGLTEILTRPASVGDGAIFERYADEIRSIRNLRLAPLDDETAIDAAWGRSTDRDLGDAVHVATAKTASATAFITNDRRVRPRSGVEIVLLDSITA